MVKAADVARLTQEAFDAERERLGDRVMGILGGGGYAERVVLHERLCLPVPPALKWEQAAAVPEAFLTAYDALFLCGGLAPGQSVLLHAAASGVGMPSRVPAVWSLGSSR